MVFGFVGSSTVSTVERSQAVEGCNAKPHGFTNSGRYPGKGLLTVHSDSLCVF